MGSIIDISRWEPTIYMIQKTDPLIGGEDGITNIQPKQLANRTKYLLDKFLAQHTAEGLHALTNADVKLDAGIVESKLKLDFPTAFLHSQTEAAYATATELYNEIRRIIDEEGNEFSAYGKAVPLSWQYSDYGFAFELFTNSFSLRYLNPVAVTSTISGSDTAVCDSTSQLSVGTQYLISDGSGNGTELITVAEILNATSFRATAPLGTTRTSGEISSTSWVVDSGFAVVNNLGRFITKRIPVLKSYSTGKVLIRRERKPGVVTAWWRNADGGAWTKCQLVASRARTEQYTDDEFLVPGGIDVQLMFEFTNVSAPIIVDHLSVFPFGTISFIDQVKKPTNVTPAQGATGITTGSVLTGSTFYSLYGEVFKHAQFQIATDVDFDDLVLDATTAAGVSLTIPSAVLEVDTEYFWRCRYTDSLNNTSKWSDALQFTTGAAFSLITRPMALSPVALSTVSTLSVTLVSSEFELDLGLGDHIASQWQVSTTRTFDVGTVVIESGEDTTNLVTKVVASSNLPASTVLYWRVRHKAQNVAESWVGWSSWSEVGSFIWEEEIVSTAVFSPYVYTGNSAVQTIANGIDLEEFGGMAWLKPITTSGHHYVFDTENGLGKLIPISNSNPSEPTTAITEVTATGFGMSGTTLNTTGTDYVSYTFRKTAKFFDVIRWTGNGNSGREIPHDLGVAPGFVIAKITSNPGNAYVYHASSSGTLTFNSKAAQMSSNIFITTVSKTSITVAHDLNLNGESYVAYLFGALPGISKIGGYTATGASLAVNCGFVSEPRFIMIKRVDAFGAWHIWDQERGLSSALSDPFLTSGAEPQQEASNVIDPLVNGFLLSSANQEPVNISAARYVYIAFA